MKYALSTIGLRSLSDLVEIYILLYYSELKLQAIRNDHQRTQGGKRSGKITLELDLETRLKKKAIK
jgi:hypothetical protein